MTVSLTVVEKATIPASTLNGTDVFTMTPTTRGDLLIPLGSLGGTQGEYARVDRYDVPDNIGLLPSKDQTLDLLTTAEFIANPTTGGVTNRLGMVFDLDTDAGTFSGYFVEESGGNYVIIGGNSTYVPFDILYPEEMDELEGGDALEAYTTESAHGNYGYYGYSYPIAATSYDGLPTELPTKSQIFMLPNYKVNNIQQMLFTDPHDRDYVIIMDVNSLYGANVLGHTIHFSLSVSSSDITSTSSSHANRMLIKRVSGVFTSYYHTSRHNPWTKTVPSHIKRMKRRDFRWPANINSDAVVPATLDLNTIYTGTAYNGDVGKLTFISPEDTTKVIVVDEPTDFNTRAGGVFLKAGIR